MAKTARGPVLDREGIAGRFKALAAARSLAALAPVLRLPPALRLHRALDRLNLIRDERVLDDVGVSRDRIRSPIGEAHWFYDKFR